MHDLGYFRANFDAIAARLATRSNPSEIAPLRIGERPAQSRDSGRPLQQEIGEAPL